MHPRSPTRQERLWALHRIRLHLRMRVSHVSALSLAAELAMNTSKVVLLVHDFIEL